jgi:hypothetical protein
MRRVKTKRDEGKEEPVSCFDPKNEPLHTYVLETEKDDKMVHQNIQKIAQCYRSQLHVYLQSKFTWKRIYHLKCRNYIVPHLFVQYGGNVEKEVPRRHITDNTAPRIVARHFPERRPPTASK